jgi:hypothetical protein
MIRVLNAAAEGKHLAAASVMPLNTIRLTARMCVVSCHAVSRPFFRFNGSTLQRFNVS